MGGVLNQNRGRIPDLTVHAKGSGAFGTLTIAGERGAADTGRDVRKFVRHSANNSRARRRCHEDDPSARRLLFFLADEAVNQRSDHRAANGRDPEQPELLDRPASRE